MQLTADGALGADGISLLTGWLPVAVQIAAAALLAFAVGWQTRRWRLIGLPVSAAIGLIAGGLAYFYIEQTGIAGGRPPPPAFWVWVVLSGFAVGVLLIGWSRNPWWRRTLSVLSVPSSLLCFAIALNIWTGYVPTVQSGWDQLTGKPLPGEIDANTAFGMRLRGQVPPDGGAIVKITTPDTASGFWHRDELVYLPPAWFKSNPPPRLPAVMMIGGQLGTPEDWFRAGGAKQVIDDFAADHGGYSPVFVFADASGSFANDTECVNGPRGNAADHLTKEIIPSVVSRFGVSPDRTSWGIAGWSMGGTCALTLTAKHPELFSAFVDIDGDAFPNAGESERDTIAHLFGGDADAFRSFDPATVMNAHGPYPPTAGWINVSENTETIYRSAATEAGKDTGTRPYPADRTTIANYLCSVASSNGIDCSVVSIPGGHDWPSGGIALEHALPWLAGRLGTPDVPQIPLPGVPP
jgi:S-formylglutathione hydrolase FrmB